MYVHGQVFMSLCIHEESLHLLGLLTIIRGIIIFHSFNIVKFYVFYRLEK